MPSPRLPKRTFWGHVRDFLDTLAPMGLVLFMFSGLVITNLVTTFYLCEDMIIDMVFKPRGESILRKYIA